MNKLYRLILCLLLVSLHASGQYVTIWKTDNDGASNSDQIMIPATGTDYSISWEEVGNPTNNGSETGTDLHILTFPSPGTYQISIEPGAGTFSRITFASSNDRNKLLEIRQWGNIRWESMAQAYQGCENVQITATDVPDLQDVTSMGSMFSNCTALTGSPEMDNWDVSSVTIMESVFSYALAFNAPIGSWNVSNVTNMDAMFQGAEAFNQPVGAWNVGNVTRMFTMFDNALAFDQPIGTWNVSKVTEMYGMFYRARSFNQNLDSWDVRNVGDMSRMFQGAEVFNGEIGGWDVGRVLNMTFMFNEAPAFNQPIGDWNVAIVQDMSFMFMLASSFNQPIDNWNVGQVTTMNSMFNTASSFNQPIGSWNVEKVTDMFMMFYDATAFNQPIGAWNTGSLTDMSYMFFMAPGFNQPLNDWNVSQVTSMSSVFYLAAAYDQPLSDWDLSSVTDMSFFAAFSAMGCNNMTATMQGWAANLATPDNIVFGANSVNYGFEAAEALDILRNTKGWSIEIGEEIDCNPVFPAFITIWNVTEVGEREYPITIPATGTDYNIAWEDVDNPANTGTVTASGVYTLNLPFAGKYKVSISPGSGSFERISFANTGDRLKLLEIRQWGEIEWNDMSEAFSGCSNLIVTATDEPDLENVTSMAGMFKNCVALTEVPGIGDWDVSEVMDMSEMFQSASRFDEDIYYWNVSRVTNMRNMFSGATSFNHSLDYWDLESATDLTDIFAGSAMDCVSMSMTLQGWAIKSWTASDVTFTATDRTYGNSGTRALDALASEKNWTILAGSEVECSALAVSLTGFEAKNENGIIRLEWATASETDNDYFEIERSADTRNWTSIGRIAGAGTVTSSRDYNETDPNPLTGVSYYRLKIVDFAGKVDYSNIRSVKVANPAAHRIYPNPATTTVTISGKSVGQLKVFNVSGLQVLQMEIKTEKALIPVDNLPSGTYVIKMDDGWNTKLIKK